MVEHEIVFGAAVVPLERLIDRREDRDVPVHQRAVRYWIALQERVELRTEEWERKVTL